MSHSTTPGARVLAAMSCVILIPSIALGQGWQWPDEGLGPNGEVMDMVVWDDGNGPALYVGGSFDYYYPQKSALVKWDGKAWSDVGQYKGGAVVSLATFDDGSGPALFVNGKAKWNGSLWTTFSGVNFDAIQMLVFDDGSGPALYAVFGGSAVVRWNGEKWVGLGQLSCPMDETRCAAVYDDGNGAKLYVGGFKSALPVYYGPFVAAWDGREWTEAPGPLASAPFSFNGYVEAMAAFDDGSGSKLFVSGDFQESKGAVANGIAVWNGQTWGKADAGLMGINGIYARDFVVLEDKGKPTLFGACPPSAIRWLGNAWESLEPLPLSSYSKCIAGFGIDNKDIRLHIGGSMYFNGKWTLIGRQKSPLSGTHCGDLTGDGFVDQQDLGVLLGDFGCTKGLGLCPGDCDNDGDTDQADLGILLANWEKPCP